MHYVDPKALELAEKLVGTDDTLLVVFDSATENDWTCMFTFVIDCFLECVRLASKVKGQQVQRREQVNLVELPYILRRIRAATGIDISITDLTDIVDGSSLPVTQEQIAELPSKALVRGEHWPLRRWFYINKDLGVILTFVRHWRIVAQA